MSDEYSCQCCGSKTIDNLGDYEICPICKWEDDPIQSKEPDYVGGANKMSLNEAKEAYKQGRKVI
ncbi:hypothetical protein CQP30_07490 [Yersinia pestis]|uniref:Cysteine-rich CPCC domain-containing protein n=4 Tax=Yersinia pestis TaxID=632 RepID=A0A3G5L375_YERPE|nr:CPCC family cysteine-rich protein [Yersinia pestis]ERP76691.1 hypothetical protein L327_04235 [Yersinia pestis S3]ERP77164.1 hypothetical protein L328_04230 [Yersinia pestis 24H]AAS63721.1 hypothetical protein YP_3570 [Yersinia pestis biovar Microtus str. 91001]ABG12369.1 conserved hypothetical protein [Yersinia pestis Antiqua]ABG19398.1 conserved hypothetical protein [Yersinia pestis Nepal516]